MDIFELVNNEKFFNPLSSKNRKIYLECMIQLIERSKEVPVLYDSDARNCIAIYLKNTDYILQNECESNEAEFQMPERNASAIMAYLRDCGWVTPRAIGRNGENVANVSVNCRRIIEFFRKMCEMRSEGVLSNHIFSMYEILKSSFEDDSARAERPYSNILKPLLGHEVELKNELLNLKDNIADIMRLVMELQDTNSVGKFLMKDEVLDKFFNDYFFIKNNGLIPSQLSFIKNKLRVIARGRMFLKMVDECAAQLQLEKGRAKEKVEAYISELQYFLTVEYEENMAYIDARINTYYNLANARIMLVMGSGVDMEAALDAFLSSMKGAKSNEKQLILEKVEGCVKICSQKYIGRKSYERRKRKERDNSYSALQLSDISETEKIKRTQEMMDSTKNRFSIEETKKFIEQRLAHNKELELKEQTVSGREEAIMFASSVMFSGIEEFPYAVEIKNDFVETNVARITNMKIRKK